MFTVQEGPGAGTYLRGEATISLPEHFGLVTEAEGLTALLTPQGQ